MDLTPTQSSRQFLIKRLRYPDPGTGQLAAAILIDCRQAANEIEALAEDKERAIFIAEHLYQMVDDETWKSTGGGSDGYGHDEGLYHAAQVWEELQGLK